MSQENKTNPSIIPLLNTLAIICTIVYGFVTVYSDDQLNISIWYIVSAILVGFTLINYKPISLFLKRLTKRIKFFRAIVFEYRKGHLEFLDKYGKRATYYEENILNKIRKGKSYQSELEVNCGVIDSDIQTFNCYNTLNNAKNKLTIVYTRKNKNQNISHNSRQLQSAFSVNFNDCFPDKEESWGCRINYYTKVYDLQISFKKKNPPRNVNIRQIKKDSNGNIEATKLPIDPIIIKKYDRVVMKVKLLHLAKSDMIYISWNWDVKDDDRKVENKKSVMELF